MAGKSKKNTGSVYDEDQLELFPDSLLSQDPEIQNSKLLDPDDRMPYGTLTYRENHDKMKDVVLGFLGKGSEMTGLEVYSKLYYRVYLQNNFSVRNGNACFVYRFKYK